MGAIDDELGRVIAVRGVGLAALERPAAPTTIAEAGAMFGDEPGEQNRVMAQRLGVTRRTVERWRKAERGEGGQTRQLKGARRARLFGLARRRQLDRWRSENRRRAAGDPVGQIRRAGVRMRLRLWYGVYGKAGKVRTAPVESSPPQQVQGWACDPAMDAWQAGDREAAGDALLEAFWVAYGVAGLGVEVGEIDWARIEIA